MGLFEKLLGEDPNSEEGSVQSEAMKDMIGDFLNSERGKHILGMVMKMVVPAFDSLKLEMGDDDKFFMFRIDKKTKTPAFWIIDSKKSNLKLQDKSAVIMAKPIDDPSKFLQELISGDLLKPNSEPKDNG